MIGKHQLIAFAAAAAIGILPAVPSHAETGVISGGPAAAETQLQEDLWSKVLAKTKVKKYPKGMIKEETEIQKAQYQRMADQYGMSPEAMGITEDQYKEMAKESLKEKLALHAIAKKEGIKVRKSDMEDFYDEILESNDMTAKEFEKAAGMSVEDYVETNYYDVQVLRDKVLEFIVDQAKLK